MTSSLVVKLWRSLANLNKSFRAFIQRQIIEYIFKDNDGNYSLTLNNINLKVTPDSDLCIKGARFLEVDAELYFIDTKNQAEINDIKSRYFEGTLFPKPELNENENVILMDRLTLKS